MSEHALLFIGAPSLSSLRSLDGTATEGFEWSTETLAAKTSAIHASESHHEDDRQSPSEEELSLELLSTYWSQMQPAMPVYQEDSLVADQDGDVPHTIDDVAVSPSQPDSIIGLTPAWPSTFQAAQRSPQQAAQSPTASSQLLSLPKAIDGNCKEVAVRTALHNIPKLTPLAQWRLDQLVTSFGIIIQVWVLLHSLEVTYYTCVRLSLFEQSKGEMAVEMWPWLL
eukprot:m.239291 g.239291  ORF g.239291 m.239291 type:complete len:225 (+) comp17432_c1_seq28:2799-3473(+)